MSSLVGAGLSVAGSIVIIFCELLHASTELRTPFFSCYGNQLLFVEC